MGRSPSPAGSDITCKQTASEWGRIAGSQLTAVWGTVLEKSPCIGGVARKPSWLALSKTAHAKVKEKGRGQMGQHVLGHCKTLGFSLSEVESPRRVCGKG